MSGYIEPAANQIADILMREGLDYTQTKAVFKQSRAKAGLHARRNTAAPRRARPWRRNCASLTRRMRRAAKSD